ncbi:hypothetical protein [Kosakonia radicincitans]|uniref:hypothetical protein n=1 Tax=Kosakonia radicincitans TaxID=283686 RepID=UPI001D075E6D|nr:hypothetical protein [Kosakonia radicincitans]
MAYLTSNPPSLLEDRISGGGALWHYESSDPISLVAAVNYITNAEALGMRKGDAINVYDPLSMVVYSGFISSLSSSGATITIASSGNQVSTVETYAALPETPYGWYLVTADETKSGGPSIYFFTGGKRYWFAMVEDA